MPVRFKVSWPAAAARPQPGEGGLLMPYRKVDWVCHHTLFFYVRLTHLCPSLPVEHRPSTTPRHRTLFWAALVILDTIEEHV